MKADMIQLIIKYYLESKYNLINNKQNPGIKSSGTFQTRSVQLVNETDIIYKQWPAFYLLHFWL